jgi:hypothetical protein
MTNYVNIYIHLYTCIHINVIDSTARNVYTSMTVCMYIYIGGIGYRSSHEDVPSCDDQIKGRSFRLYSQVYTYVCIHICIYKYMYIYVFIYVYIYEYMCKSVSISISIYVELSLYHMFACVFSLIVYLYLCIYIHVCVYLYYM